MVQEGKHYNRLKALKFNFAPQRQVQLGLHNVDFKQVSSTVKLAANLVFLDGAKLLKLAFMMLIDTAGIGKSPQESLSVHKTLVAVLFMKLIRMRQHESDSRCAASSRGSDYN